MPDKLHPLVYSCSPADPLGLPQIDVLTISPLPCARDGFVEHLLAQAFCKNLEIRRGMRQSLFLANSQSRASVFYPVSHVSSVLKTNSEYRTAYLGLWLLKM